ncbi:MAG: Kazal-type serine protease inhibitor domain-containing protein [Candidatus Andersenbacteria bacterium]
MRYYITATLLTLLALLSTPVAYGQGLASSTLSIQSVLPNPIQPGQTATVYGSNIPSSFTLILNGPGGVFRDFGASDIPSRGFFTLPRSIPAGGYQLVVTTSSGASSNALSVQIGGTVAPAPPVVTPRPTPRPTPIPTPPSRRGECICIEILAPVCGVDNRTYANQCLAQCNNVPIAFTGVCPGDQDFIDRFRPPRGQINPTPRPPQQPELEQACNQGSIRCLSALGQAIERFGGSFGFRDAINVLQVQLNRVSENNRLGLQQFIRDLQR